MKKRFKKFIAGLSSMAIIIRCACLIPTMSVNAYSSTRTIDNDSIASGYGNFNRGFTYIKASSLYNGDARLSSTSVSSPRYCWDYPTMSSSGNTCTIKVQAYLNHANFTDTAAYYVEYSPNISIRIGYINQDKAPGGWSSISRASISPASGTSGFSSSTAEVNPSGASGKQTGADGLKVTMVVS